MYSSAQSHSVKALIWHKSDPETDSSPSVNLCRIKFQYLYCKMCKKHLHKKSIFSWILQFTFHHLILYCITFKADKLLNLPVGQSSLDKNRLKQVHMYKTCLTFWHLISLSCLLSVSSPLSPSFHLSLTLCSYYLAAFWWQWVSFHPAMLSFFKALTDWRTVTDDFLAFHKYFEDFCSKFGFWKHIY